MRLIDADEFMENLIYCDGLGRRGLEAVLKTLKEQPIAYDISKVVATLESKRDYKTIDNYYGETIGAIEIRSIDIGEAIEIVKAGCVE